MAKLDHSRGGVMTRFGRFVLDGVRGGHIFMTQSEKPVFCLNLTKLTLI